MAKGQHGRSLLSQGTFNGQELDVVFSVCIDFWRAVVGDLHALWYHSILALRGFPPFPFH